MSNVDLDLDDDDDDLDFQGDAAQLVSHLRQVAKDAKKAVREANKEAERGRESTKKLAFIEAELPNDDPKVAFFLENYKGDYTKEAIRAAAQQHGFIAPDVNISNEVKTVEQMMAANNGSTSPAAPGTEEAMLAEIRAVKETGPGAAEKIASIMASYGRYQEDED
jgi:hypothetical protein